METRSSVLSILSRSFKDFEAISIKNDKETKRTRFRGRSSDVFTAFSPKHDLSHGCCYDHGAGPSARGRS